MKRSLTTMILAGLVVSACGKSSQSSASLEAARGRKATKFSCSNVGDHEEWTIYIDLKKKLAGFFDNDTTAVVKFKETMILESNPSQTVHLFEGKDRVGDPNDQIKITFNETEKSAHVTLNLDGEIKTLESIDGCKADSSVNLSIR